MAEAILSGPARDGTKLPAATAAFGPLSVGRVGPPSLAQMVLRARARLAERERLGAKLLSIAGILFSLPLMIDLMGFTGVITAQSRLSTSPLLREMLVNWSVTLVDGAAVLLECLLLIACFAEAARLNAGRPKGAWMLSLFGAAGSLLWLPVLWGVVVEILPVDGLTALTTSLFPGLGFTACLLMIAGGLVARLRPVRAYAK